jgi:hypothetical protein
MKMRSFILSALLLSAACTLIVGNTFGAEKSTFFADNQEYVGSYTMTGLPFEKVVVSERAGKLYYVAGEYEGEFMAVSGKADTYSANGQATVTFVRNAAGKVEKITLEVQGETFEGLKAATDMAAGSAVLTDYVGKYKMENLPFEFIELSMKDGQLYITAGDNEGTLTAVPNQVDSFDAGGQAAIKFTRDEQKKIKKMIVEAQGQVFEGTPVAQ